MTRNIFISFSKAQGDYEQLKATLKLLKGWNQKEVSDPTIRPEQLQEIDEDNKIVIEVNKLLPNKVKQFDALSAAIKSWFRSEQYRKKHYDYRRLAKELRIQKTNRLYYDPFGNNLDENLDKKIALANRLTYLAEQLAHEYTDIVDGQFELLEIELSLLLTSEDYLILHASGIRKDPDTLLQFISRKVKYFLVRIVRKLHKTCKRDVRTKLREMIRLHFKSMDDETDADQYLINAIKRLINFKLIISWIPNNAFKNLMTY